MSGDDEWDFSDDDDLTVDEVLSHYATPKTYTATASCGKCQTVHTGTSTSGQQYAQSAATNAARSCCGRG